jgi:hypothetical protein
MLTLKQNTIHPSLIRFWMPNIHDLDNIHRLPNTIHTTNTLLHASWIPRHVNMHAIGIEF